MIQKQLLEQTGVFQDLNAGQLEKVRGYCQTEEYEAGAIIFSERTPAGKLYVLVQGKVALQMRVSSGRDQLSKRVTVDMVGEGDVFGWSAAVSSQPYTLTAVCLEPTKVAAVDGSSLKALMKEDHHVGYHVLHGLINIVASRLEETRQLLVTERMLSA